MELKVFLDNISTSKYRDVQKAIIEECYINRSTFHHWRSGKNQPPTLAKMKINEITQRYTNQKVYNL